MFGERFKELLARMHYTGNAFGREIGADGSLINKTMRGDNLPSVKFCLQIHDRFPEINLDWLITGRGEAFLPGDAETEGLKGSDQAPSHLVAEQKSTKKPSRPEEHYKELYEQSQETIQALKAHIDTLKGLK